MTSTSTLSESTVISHNSQRNFLLQRLMEDSSRLRSNGQGRKSPSETVASNGRQRRRKGAPVKTGRGRAAATEEEPDRMEHEHQEDNVVKMENGTAGTAPNLEGNHRQQGQFGKLFSSGLNLFDGPLHQYAATLAAAHFMQATAAGARFPAVSGQPTSTTAASALPLLIEHYPMLYRSLFSNAAMSNGNGNGNGLNVNLFPNYNSGGSETGAKSDPSSTETSVIPSTTEKRMARISLASPQQTNSTPSPRKRAPPKTKESTSKSRGSPIPSGVGGGGTPKKARAIRRIQFDDEMCSPVSGMYIKEAEECMNVGSPSSQTDNDPPLLDDTARWVEMTEEAKTELAKIPNVIGDYICRLCKVRYADAFQLAKHRCPRIAHEEYRCPECDKVFSCPANLASHRRWHKPKDFVKEQGKNGKHVRQGEEKVDSAMDDTPIDLSNSHTEKSGNGNGDNSNDFKDEEEDDEMEKSQLDQLIVSTPACHECQTCGKRFDAHRWLRAHAVSHTNFGGGQFGENGNEQDCKKEQGEQIETQCIETGCQLWFLSNDALEKHQRRAHPKFVCKFCQHSFPTSPALTRHINRNHPATAAECRVILLSQSPPTRA